ncbi:E3 ubiquitin-protein ligase NRDP1-like [Dendronephthya gigantea]|uniref:E3 ubiquitin-protein ligase NRDP1-like n=1 Tax=Dendronephthya gigantea TaxID=151771 RepID=UPI00106BC7CF|nr:E3 ubiquitin-protein ligase NRDP1-like [Dendronephthya gigantea]
MAEGYDTTRFRSTVDDGFICCICLGVLKDPMQCENNEHYFCSCCIKKHLEKTSQSCPVCQDKLTVETLRKAPRIVAYCVSRYKIDCDNKERGCDAVLELGALKKHVENCEFAPVFCSNKGCNDVVNERDVKRHELELCRFKAATCVVCGKKMPQHEYDAHGCVLRRNLKKIKKDLVDMRATQHEVLNEMRQMTAAMKNLEKSCRKVGDVLNTRNIDIVVIGGEDAESQPLSSVERFNLFNQTWTSLGELKIGRCLFAAVLFENQIFVCGGCTSDILKDTTDTIEVLDLKGNTPEWKEFAANMPIKVAGHQCVIHGNSLLIIGGCTNGEKGLDTIYELLLVPPYSSKLLCHMKKKRALHKVQLFDNKVLIAGGVNDDKGTESSVEIFDITRNKCIGMPPLPSPVSSMATVRRGDGMLLIGGLDAENNVRKEIIEYDFKTGRSKVLLTMETKQNCCCAVCHENTVFVFGATKDDDQFVRCLNFLTNSWNKLPAMAEARISASAVIVEKKNLNF